MTSHTITIKREELYERVWDEPIQKLSKRYFMSDRGLGKLCARHNIPVPPRGYWARVAHGQKPRRPSLPPLEPGQGDTIYFGQRPMSSATLEAEVVQLPPEIEFERRPENQITVSDTLQTRHPLIQSTRRYWEAAQRGEIQYGQNKVPYLNIRVSSPTRPRALRLMHVLLTAVEQRGHSASATVDGKTILKVLDEPLEVSLREIRRHVRHTPTAAELAEMKKWSLSRPAKFDELWTADLELKIENAWDTRHTWRDGKRQRLEGMLNQVIEGLIRVSQLCKARNARIEQQRTAWEQAEKRRRDEEERIRQWDEWMTAWKRTNDVRAFAAAIREACTPVEPGSKVEGWLTWALTYADQIDPLRPK